jgi:hypothetical protein
MTPKRRGRPKNVPPGYEWLLTLPEHLRSGGERQLLIQNRWLADLEKLRRELVREHGGVGVSNDLAYAVADAIAWDSEMGEELRQEILKQLEAARALVARGNHKGGKVVRSKSDARREAVLDRHTQMIADRRTRGHSESAIANRLVELEGSSLSTAKRWLRK